MSYQEFVSRKLSTIAPSGIRDGFSLPASLFPHQSALTAWALRRGRSAIFADTGLGKSRMELAWADAVRKHTGQPVLILA
ncbi:MAG: DEAD/DEAH box helicase family protein, partial [Gammaproteobacteria bacterium]